ncbi:hypothetical protein [Variovorax sp. LjRoot178]|uniref:hypothetical protein n=1 Tax=Variovorax sp. LjRoot178 TaxID=3342277 RepID=UPI003ED136E5
MIDPNKETILITGAGGRIGIALRYGLRSGRRHLRLTDVCPLEDLADNEDCVVADVSDRAAYENMMEGVSAAVHVAGAGANYSLEHLPHQCARVARCPRVRAPRRREADRLRQ